jgi:hypothetical protein
MVFPNPGPCGVAPNPASIDHTPARFVEPRKRDFFSFRPAGLNYDKLIRIVAEFTVFSLILS